MMARRVAGNFSSGGRKWVTRIFQFCRWLLAGSTAARIVETLALNALPMAKLGYLNVRLNIGGHKVNTIALDPERAQLCAAGLRTVRDRRGDHRLAPDRARPGGPAYGRRCALAGGPHLLGGAADRTP